MFNAYHNLNALLSKRERFQAKLVFLLMLLSAIMQMVGVASVMPFVAVLSNPEIVESNQYMALIYEKLGFVDIQDFLLFLGIIFFVIYVFSLAVNALMIYAITRFSSMRLHTIASKLLRIYLMQPYIFYLGRNTSELGTTILSEVGQVTNGVLIPGLRLISDLLVTLTLFILLVVVEPLTSLMVALLLGGSYFLVYLLFHRLIRRIGEDRLTANKQRYIRVNECLNGIKELKLMGRERTYLNKFMLASARYARHQATHRIVGLLPRYGIEIIAFGGILLLVLYLIGRYGGLENALPVIALYTFAGYRLMPSFQEIFRNIIQLRFALPVLESFSKDIVLRENIISQKKLGEITPIILRDSIRLESIDYKYPGMDTYLIKNLSLSIKAGSCVAFAGSTGAGKSTIIDLILGLISPESGVIKIDNTTLNENNKRSWQDNIGYVPQSIFLADDTVSANITFGLPQDDIDTEALVNAAKIANIHEFIKSELPQGYDTIIGERGIRLSGGQRQRLGIARALYHNPDIVVFDEATSALDNATEAAVMEAIEELHGYKTVILVAHRLSTIKNCDCIYFLREGNLVAKGNFDELIKSNKDFLALSRLKENKLYETNLC